jgi:2-dehydro-3-deoxyphosphogluconate aldolase/(4S)-4-hydroxy-2-oxoglutarate aldolase
MSEPPDSAVPTPMAQRPDEVTAAITAGGVVAVLRATSAEHFAAVTDALVRTGVRAIEITLTAPTALRSITELAAEYAADAIIGAGTVLTADQAEACIDAGAAFLVSPTASPDVVAAAQVAGVAVYPGAFTPTELLAAHRTGADAVKLFPASAVGPGYLKDLRGPLPDIAVMPTGGIAITDIGDWIAAGAVAVGLGTPLLGDAVRRGVDPGLVSRARQAIDAVAAARSG